MVTKYLETNVSLSPFFRIISLNRRYQCYQVDDTLDFIDIHKEFSKQDSAIKPLFDTNDVSGVHISSSGEEKLCEIFSKYLTALPGKREFPVTPQHDKKRNLSDIIISPSSAEAKPKHTKAGSPMMSGTLNR